MDRRTLLQRILHLAGAKFIAPLAAGSSPAIPLVAAAAVTAPRILLQRSALAGFQHHEGESLWLLLSIGAPLRLIREPGNPHDARAVRIDFMGRKLGYLPRIDNAAVSQLLDRGQRLEGRIAALRRDPDPWRRVEVAIELLPSGSDVS